MLDEPGVESTMNLLPCLNVHPRVLVERVEQPLKRTQVLGGELPHAVRHSEALRNDPDRVQLLEILDRQRRDPGALIDLRLDQPLALQQTQRLANRPTTDAEPLSQLDLRDSRPPSDRATQNVP